MLADDVDRFADLPGVSVHNLPDMTPSQISDLVRPGRSISRIPRANHCDITDSLT
jgi:hypothetical protein